MTNDKALLYLGVAKAVAKFSKDESTKVGAVVVGATGEVRSVGYNGAPRGSDADENERGRVRPEKYFWFSHAELNAVTNAAKVGIPLDGSSIVVTHHPCMDCARAIVQAGITTVYVPQWDASFESRWYEHMWRAKFLFTECGVNLVVLPTSEESV